MEGLQLVYDSRGLYLWLALCIVLAIAMLWLVVLHGRLSGVAKHYRRLTRGAVGGNFDEMLLRHLGRLDETAQKLDDVAALCDGLNVKVRQSVQHVGVVRFNPFTDVGGDQSFAVALLDANGDGLVVSSLFGRHESRVYAKPVENGRSKYSLSQEEEQAIQVAQRQESPVRAR